MSANLDRLRAFVLSLIELHKQSRVNLADKDALILKLTAERDQFKVLLQDAQDKLGVAMRQTASDGETIIVEEQKIAELNVRISAADAAVEELKAKDAESSAKVAELQAAADEEQRAIEELTNQAANVIGDAPPATDAATPEAAPKG
jgi:chromosome segregation ATPase